MTMMMQIRNLEVSYGHVDALKNIHIDVEQGSIVSIIGSNGAGKSTLLQTISGLVPPKRGEILFEGEKLPSMAHKIVHKGIVHVPEGRRVFSGLTVEENLAMGGIRNKVADSKKREQEMFELFPRLAERKKQHAGTLSGGEQQMLAIARGLMANPKLILLDEPSLGLAPVIVKQVFKLIENIRAQGITILLVEQNATQALALSDYAYVLENGEIAFEGKSELILQSDEIKRAYLGDSKSCKCEETK